MDELDFDDIELALGEVSEHDYLIHFVGDAGDGEPTVSYSLTATEFSRHRAWVGIRAQDFEKEHLPRVTFVDPSHLLQEGDWQSYALEDYDYENLMDRLDLSNPRVATDW